MKSSRNLYQEADRTAIDYTLRVNSALTKEGEGGGVARVVTGNDADAEEARLEHASLKDLPLCVGAGELTKRLGQGVPWFFCFLKYMFILNIVLALVGLINLIPHFYKYRDALNKDPNKKASFDVIFVSSYEAGNKNAWMTSSGLIIIVLFMCGPIYAYYVDWYRKKRESGDAGYVEDPFEGQYQVDSDDCVDKIKYPGGAPTAAEQTVRRTFSIIVFIGVLFGQGIVNWYLQRALRRLGESLIALLLSLVMSAINITWKFICEYLTVFEKHTYHSDARRWDCFKVFLFKMLNLLVLMLVKKIELLDNTTDCPLQNMGSQFVFLFFVDFAANIATGLILPLLENCWSRRKAETSTESNDALKATFVLSEQYVEGLYRQFIVCMGVFVVPVLPFLQLIASMFEYWLDKYRLLRITQKPQKTNNSFRNVLLFFSFCIALASLVAYPNGAIFILAGIGGIKSNAQCTIFN